MEILKIKRSGLSIFHTGSLEPSQGSYDVPVALENDETYTDYTISMYVGYYVNGVLKKRKCETDSEGHYLIPGVAFLRSGIISISFLLETADKSQGLMTNALSYDVKYAPNVAVEVPPDPTWQELVKEWIEEISSKPTDEQVKKAVDDYIDEHGIETAGLTQEQIIALDNMFKVVAYIKEDVTSEYNAFKTAFGITGSGNEEPDTPTVTLTSISATYSGGNVLVGTSVNSLSGITVKANYSDGTSKTVTTYTLSGTINEGNNTITVSYQGKTATFTVVGYVEQEEPSEPVYKLASATTLDGTSGIDSGYILNDVDKDFSILIEYEPTSDGGIIFDATKNGNAFGPTFKNVWAQAMRIGGDYTGIYYVGGTTKTKFIMTHVKGSGVFNTFIINTEQNYINTQEVVYESYATNQHTVGNTNTLKIGANYTNANNFFTGTIHQFEIHERVITDEEIDTFMNPTWVEPSEPINLIDISTCTLGGTMDDGRSISTDYYITDYIPITYGNPYITNITKYVDDSTTVTQYIYRYDSDKKRLALNQLDIGSPMGTYWDIKKVYIAANSNCSYVRLVFHKNYKDIAFFGEGLV